MKLLQFSPDCPGCNGDQWQCRDVAWCKHHVGVLMSLAVRDESGVYGVLVDGEQYARDKEHIDEVVYTCEHAWIGCENPVV